MNVILKTIGVIAVIISFIVGFFTGLLGFIIWLTGGISIAAILFACSRILENQNYITSLLQQQVRYTEKLHNTYTKCPNCGYEYEDSRTSCPNCGRRS